MQLVINSPGTFITQKDGIFRLKNKDKRFDVSPLKIGSIVIANQAMITTQAIGTALEKNIDIVENKPRTKVAKECKKFGLIRVQKSVFLGRLESNRFDELSEKCRDLIDEKTDSVYLFPFCQEDFRNIKVLGQGFDRKLVNDEILAKFF